MSKNFSPKPGQTDFSNLRYAPVINCVVKYRDKILVMHRSSELNLYPDTWNGVSGFLDDEKTIEEKAKQELAEEAGVTGDEIISIKTGQFFEIADESINKVWIVHPVLVEVNTDQIKTDWEAQDYKWLTPQEAVDLKVTPGFERVIKNFFQTNE